MAISPIKIASGVKVCPTCSMLARVCLGSQTRRGYTASTQERQDPTGRALVGATRSERDALTSYDRKEQSEIARDFPKKGVFRLTARRRSRRTTPLKETRGLSILLCSFFISISSLSKNHNLPVQHFTTSEHFAMFDDFAAVGDHMRLLKRAMEDHPTTPNPANLVLPTWVFWLFLAEFVLFVPGFLCVSFKGFLRVSCSPTDINPVGQLHAQLRLPRARRRRRPEPARIRPLGAPRAIGPS